MRADDVTRNALDGAAVADAAVRPGGLWRGVEVTPVAGSTNADLLARAAAGAPEGLVLAAEEQRAGRGRMDRAWVSRPRAGLTFSMLLRPPAARRGWLPLLSGLAVADAVRSVAAVPARLKWPNDVLVGGAKLAGILAEASADAVVVGVGINVSAGPAELPPAPENPGALPATSLAILGSSHADRAKLLTEVLAGVEHWYQAWRRAAGDPDRCGLRAEYALACATLGRPVRVERPAGQPLSGLAAGVDSDGRLLLRVSSGTDLVPVAAGDVVHLRRDG
jgi:BirA family transcriptional regulator, biotin operon repressor / biotin---[acetyl-CoA-carboxylase] ligase